MKNIVFMGTPQFSVPILEALIKNETTNVMAVVTQPDRKVGRKKKMTAPPVKELALKYDLEVLQPEKMNGSKEMKAILSMQPDLIITAAYGQMLPEKLLMAPTYKSINVHASLLPKYRGAAPIHYAIWNGDENTGVTIMYMTKKMDAGDIISQRAIKINNDDDTGLLFEKLSIVGKELLMDTLPDIFNNTISPITQDENLVSYSPMISRDQEKLNWNKTAGELHNKIRAFRPFPGTYTILDGSRFKVWESKAVQMSTDKEPGEFVKVDKDNLLVACGEQSVLSLLTVQPAGKPKMDITSYLSGSNVEVGMSFGE